MYELADKNCNTGGGSLRRPHRSCTVISLTELRLPHSPEVSLSQIGAEMYSMGMNKFQSLAKDAGAILKIDRMVLVDLECPASTFPHVSPCYKAGQVRHGASA